RCGPVEADRFVDGRLCGRKLVHGAAAGCEPAVSAGSGTRPGGGSSRMSDLLEPADPGGGDRVAVSSGQWAVGSDRPLPAVPPTASLPTAHRPLPAPLLLFEHVSQWSGP